MNNIWKIFSLSPRDLEMQTNTVDEIVQLMNGNALDDDLVPYEFADVINSIFIQDQNDSQPVSVQGIYDDILEV
ncbi:hypothetical protein ACFLZI_01160 [Nitrospirota bacterium]